MSSHEAFVRQLHGSKLRQSRPAQRLHGLSVEWLDMRGMKLSLGSFVPVVWNQDQSDGTDIGARLVEFARTEAGNSPTIFLEEQGQPVRSVLDAVSPRLHSIALLSTITQSAVIEARDHERRWQLIGEAVATDIGHGALSPYTAGRPASGSRFFGRSRLLEQVVSGKVVQNCTIVGNRRIGKTSLLHEIEARLSQIYVPKKSIHFVKLYSSKFKSTWDAVYVTLSQLGIQVPKSYSKLGAIAPRYIKRFPQLVHDFARHNNTYVVFLIDEFDSFLALDAENNWEFLHLLRETAAEDGPCSVVIAGFRMLMQTRIRQDNPYYNFTREIALKPLSREETLEMVQVPLGRLGLDVAGTNIPTFIYRETRGLPELIQMYCGAVITLFERRGVLPHDSEVAHYVGREEAFTRTILHTFLKNANAIEQALCFRLMKRSTDGSAFFEFKSSDADEALAGLGFRLGNTELATLLNNLVVGSFIERVSGTPGHFRFAVPQLVRYCQAVSLDNLLAKALSEARSEGVADALGIEPPEIES